MRLGEPAPADGSTEPAAVAAISDAGPKEPAGLDADACIEGRVLTPSGLPAAGASVAAYDRGTLAVWMTRAGPDGSYSLPVPPGRAHVVVADLDGLAPAMHAVSVAPAHVDLLLGEGTRIRGRVVDRFGRGVPRVVLRLGADAPFSAADLPPGIARRAATSEDDGAFVMAGIHPGTFVLEVAAGPVRVGDTVQVSAPYDWLVEVEVERALPVRLAGFVRRETDGAPVANAIVSAPSVAARTGEDGSFALEVPPGRLSLTVRAARCQRTIDLALKSPPDPLIILMPAARAAGGHVQDDVGRPVAGARVTWIGREGSVHLLTGADGAFRFEGVEEGGVLRAEAAGCAPAEVQPRPGETDVVLRLQAGGSVSGRVIGPDGPIAGARVRILPDPCAIDAPLHAAAARTDANGGYRFEDLPAGRWCIVFESGHARVESAAGTMTAAPDVLLSAGAPLAGLVVDARGRPLPAAVVWSLSETGAHVAVADAEGRFALPRQPSVDIELVVRCVGHASLRLDPGAIAEAPLRIRLDAPEQSR